MADRPILFSAPMALAILAGTKTQTRRVLNPQPRWVQDGVMYWRGTAAMIGAHRLRYSVGDRLWVREAWRTEARFDPLPPRDLQPGNLVSYEADYDGEPNDGCRGRLRPGMFMPRWASRITLTVTVVRVERLQDISETDVWAEGLDIFPGPPGYAQSEYAALWDAINGDGAWAANPWVAAYTFTVERRNIDAEAAHG